MQRVGLSGVSVPVALAVPQGAVRGGLVALHPAGEPSRNQPLLRHLAEVLPSQGVAVLLHDRRPAVEPFGAVPLRLQADDAQAIAGALRDVVGPVRLGFWGWSQGAWAAALAAVEADSTAFLVLVGAAGVSPAEQMRWAVSHQLRHEGYGDSDVATAMSARGIYEAAVRGMADSADAQAALDDVAQQPWGALAGLPLRFRGPGSWSDMDFDPVPVFERVKCPVLAVWGDADPWIPVDDSEAALRHALGDRLSVLRLPATGHGPNATDSTYEAALVAHVVNALA
ncbi:MAG: hypothetical protein WD794_10890 [Mycobacteriales bacterium]